MDPCIGKFLLENASDLEREFIVDLTNNPQDKVTRNIYTDYLKENDRYKAADIIQWENEDQTYYGLYLLSGIVQKFIGFYHPDMCSGVINVQHGWSVGQIREYIFDSMLASVSAVHSGGEFYISGTILSTSNKNLWNYYNKFSPFLSGTMYPIEYKGEINQENFSILTKKGY